MFKTGIYTIDQARNPKHWTNLLGDERKISVALYEDLVKESGGEEIAEKILLLVTDERGAYKRTYQKRFEVFDDLVKKHLQEKYEADENLSIHDLGVSDGRTAFDFFTSLASHFPNLSYFASDYDPWVYVIKSNNLTLTLSSADKVLEIAYPPFVLNTNRLEKYYPFNMLLTLYLKKFHAPLIVQAYKNGAIKGKKIQLFAPHVLNLASHDKRFELGQQDLLKPFTQKTKVVRAMNVLNTSYFTTEEFLKVLKNIYEALMPQGIFITGSNQDAGSTVDGGLYEKTNTGFRLIAQSGNSSPIHNLILDFRA